MARVALEVPPETAQFAASIVDRTQVVVKADVDARPALGEALRALFKPLYSSDNGLTFRAYKLCAGCGHDTHNGAGKCSGLTARPEITTAVGSICLCESTP